MFMIPTCFVHELHFPHFQSLNSITRSKEKLLVGRYKQTTTCLRGFSVTTFPLSVTCDKSTSWKD